MSSKNNFSELSISLTKKLKKDEKKKNGIFFTPSKTAKKNIEVIKPFFENYSTIDILEPSCGSGEYISKILDILDNDNINITGIEYNKTIYDSIKEIYSEQLVNTIHEDFITYNLPNKYDLIIGNPPYFVMKKNEVQSSYYQYFEGRPNIFIMFIIKSLKLLKENGILSFVLPKNFLNCLYYDKTREYIKNNYKILDIYECKDDYIETQQETIILIIQNTNDVDNNKKYTLNVEGFNILSTLENIDKLKSLYTNTTTLNKLGFDVNVGSVVWNQVKKQLTNDSKNTLLIYSSDIKNNKVEIQKYSNKDKKNYITKTGNKDTLLVINRGYGKGTYKFNYCLINDTNNEEDQIEYLIENHLICIKSRNKCDKTTLVQKYKQIIKSFNDERTARYISLYFGNNAINTTELYNIFPIYID